MSTYLDLIVSDDRLRILSVLLLNYPLSPASSRLDFGGPPTKLATVDQHNSIATRNIILLSVDSLMPVYYLQSKLGEGCRRSERK